MEGSAPLRVLGETAYPLSAASARVRIAAMAPYLRPSGIALDFLPNQTDAEYRVLASPASPARKAGALAASVARAARRRPAHDLLLVHRLRHLCPVPGIDPPRRLDAYDFDDALFETSAAEFNRGFQWLKQEARRSVECLRRARLVIAGNAYLASRVSQYAGRVEVIPSCVATDGQPVRRHGEREEVTVGWIGSHTTAEYLRPLLPVFDRLHARGGRVRLVAVGAQLALAAPWLEQREWSLEREAADLAGFDIGIMPMPDTEWTRGKCGYKILQYFAAGVPAIASPVGISSELVGTDRGELANSEPDWENAITQLSRDAATRSAQGAAARTFAEQHYSYARWAPELAAMLGSL